jgi:hypothetical protein
MRIAKILSGGDSRTLRHAIPCDKKMCRHECRHGTQSACAADQKNNFKPNWICRDVVVVEVIRPAEGLNAVPENTVAFGVPKLG